MQAVCVGHSELSLHSGARIGTLSGTIFKHCTLGFPVYPIGQVQLDACKRDLQIALAPQGSTLHASLQVPSTHFCGSGQSRSIEHDGVGVTLGLHSPFGPINESSGHTQITVLMGELFSTLHVCVK